MHSRLENEHRQCAACADGGAPARVWDGVLEIGTEEMPARFAGQIIEQATRGAAKLLADARVAVERVECYTTPRRIILGLSGLAPRQASLDVELRGPAVRIAFDASGKPTKALEGFARSVGVSLESIERRGTDSGEYVFARKTDQGKPTAEVLASVFPALIDTLTFPKAMRWGDHDYRFGRPIRWILALLGDDVVDFAYHDITSGRATYGHRTLAPGAIEVPSSEAFAEALESAGVMYDQAKRAERITAGTRALAAAIGGVPVIDTELLDEVVNLVEWPTPFAGAFDPAYLELPEACVTTPMVDHQRYFPVRDGEGRLMAAFIGVRNGGDRSIDAVRAGNERVLAARLADAKFFFEEDMSSSLVSRVEKLKGVVFQEKLGTMHAKAIRVGQLVAKLLAGSTAAAMAEPAALLAKADLLTSVVREFTELQGVMGREYALRQGIEPELAEAIYEHYLPRFTGDALPVSQLGAALSVADKIDTIVGYFGIGLIPSGSVDPYALRRQAAGVLAVYVDARYVYGLDSLVEDAARLYVDAGVIDEASVDGLVRQVMEFIATRLKVSMEEAGVRYDIADAAIAAGIGMPACTWERAWAVTSVAGEPWFEALATAASRVRNISTHAAGAQFTPGLFIEPAEFELHKAMVDLEDEVRPSVESRMSGFIDRNAYSSALGRTSEIVSAINQYFEAVMVMADDAEVRANRLGMLKVLHNTLSLAVDMSKIVFAQREQLDAAPM